MQRFDVFCTQNSYISDVSELRSMADAAEKALCAVRSVYAWGKVVNVHVLGGYEEWEDGCASFSSRNYPFWDDDRCMSWDELLIRDYESERIKVLREGDMDYFYLTVGGAILTVLAGDEPLVLTFTGDGGLKPLLDPEGESSRAFLDALERAFPQRDGESRRREKEDEYLTGLYSRRPEGWQPESDRAWIRELKAELRRLKDSAERPGKRGRPALTPGTAEKLEKVRRCLENAKSRLAEAGEPYEPDEEDLRAKEFLDGLPVLSSIRLEMGGRSPDCFSRTIEIVGPGIALHSGDGRLFATYWSEAVRNKRELIRYLKRLHVEEWAGEYWPERFGTVVKDGVRWEATFGYSDGRPPRSCSGSNAWPWDFEEFRALFLDGYAADEAR